MLVLSGGEKEKQEEKGNEKKKKTKEKRNKNNACTNQIYSISQNAKKTIKIGDYPRETRKYEVIFLNNLFLYKDAVNALQTSHSMSFTTLSFTISTPGKGR
jgi:hypothetical protein